MCVATGGGSSTDPNNIGNRVLGPGFGSTDFTGTYTDPKNQVVAAGPYSSGDFKSAAMPIQPTAVTPAPAAAAPTPTAATPEPTPSTPIPPLVPRQPTVDEPQAPTARWGERYYRSKTARGEGSVARFGSTGGSYKSALGSA